MIFSGPIPPAGLGAALAAAELHLRPEFEDMQGELRDRVSFARAGLAQDRAQPGHERRDPVLVIHYDSPDTAIATVQGLRERGFYTCVSTFPAVPMNRPSLRFTMSRHNSFSDIEALIAQLAVPSVSEEGAA